MTPPPSQTLSAIAIGSADSQPIRRGSGSMGCVAVSSCTRVASWHAAPIVIGATSPAQQRGALVPGAGRRAVELRQQLLRARELGRAVGVAAVVQLAPQHPLSHLAHP
jgi:hypothetical protein